MTEKEALEDLKSIHYNKHGLYTNDEPAWEIAFKALEKQIPKKPFHDDSVGVPNGCNSCGNLLLPEDNFCPICGQAIAWEDEEWKA